MRSLNRASDSQSPFSGKRYCSSVLEIDTWIPSKIQAISPLVDHVMTLIEGSQCVPGEEFNVELALRGVTGTVAIGDVHHDTGDSAATEVR